MLYIYTPDTNEWITRDTPMYYYGLTTYHSQLVLVGGTMYVGGSLTTNKLWTLSEDDQWQETLPSLPTPCSHASAVSHGDHLLVINDYPNNQVYVYNGDYWASAQPPPQRLSFVKSTVFNGHWYLIGGEVTLVQKNCVYSASLDLLISSCHPSDTSQPLFVWKRLTDPPTVLCCPAVFGNRLVALGEGSPVNTTSLHAYSSLTQSWVHMHMGNSPVSSSSAPPCAIVLPSNELMVLRGRTAFKVALKSKSALIQTLYPHF